MTEIARHKRPKRQSNKLSLKQQTKKLLLATLLRKASAKKLETPEDYKNACMNLTGYELLPANYDLIINHLKK